MNGVALVLSAPSGAGKSTLCAMLAREFPGFFYSVSWTTRSPRDGEINGKDYVFATREKFERARDAGKFAEWAEVHGNFYGTPLEPARAALASGRDALFDVDVKGAAQIKLTMPEARFAFILPPSMRELERRARDRGKDDEASLVRRMSRARDEIREATWYDALILNDNLERAYNDLKTFYRACALEPARNTELMRRLLAEGNGGGPDCGF